MVSAPVGTSDSVCALPITCIEFIACTTIAPAAVTVALETDASISLLTMLIAVDGERCSDAVTGSQSKSNLKDEAVAVMVDESSARIETAPAVAEIDAWETMALVEP